MCFFRVCFSGSDTFFTDYQAVIGLCLVICALKLRILARECCTGDTIVALQLFLHKFCVESLPRVCLAIPGLIAVSWLLIRPQPVQETLFRCELASVSVSLWRCQQLFFFFTSSAFGWPASGCTGSLSVAVVLVSSSTTAQFLAIATSS